MKKRTIIYIACAVAIALIIAFVVYFIINANKSRNTEGEQKIIITKYGDDFEIEKTVEITDKKEIKEFNKTYGNPSLEQDDTSPYLAIRNDIKVDLGNGKFFMIQEDFSEYCYYEDANLNTKLVIKMPKNLLDVINNILSNTTKEIVNSNNQPSTELSEVIINIYESNSIEPTNTITVQNEEKILEITNLASKITKLTADEYVDLLLLTDIEIVIDNSSFISLQKDIPNYCYYNNVSGESYLSKTPSGLFELINDIINN